MSHRKLFDNLLAHLPKKEFSIITGARQTGKSTLLRQIEEKCLQEGIQVVFINLENKTILAELNDNPLNVLKFASCQLKEKIYSSDLPVKLTHSTFVPVSESYYPTVLYPASFRASGISIRLDVVPFTDTALIIMQILM